MCIYNNWYQELGLRFGLLGLTRLKASVDRFRKNMVTLIDSNREVKWFIFKKHPSQPVFTEMRKGHAGEH